MQSVQPVLKRLTPLWLALGLGGLIVAGLVRLFQGKFDAYAQGSLALGLVAFALALILNRDEAMNWLGGRQARYGGNTLLMTAAFVLIVVMINYLVVKNPMQWKMRWDLTEEKTNTLAPETLAALKQLTAPVRAIGFYPASWASTQRSTQDLLDNYKAESGGRFTYEFHDPDAEPGLAREYNITRYGTLVLEMGDQKEEISLATEQEITGALVRFAHPGKRVIYFLTGHGEKDITAGDNAMSGVVELLKKQNYAVQPLNLQVTTTVPSDARAVVIAGPLVPVSADEASVIGNYLRYNANSALIVMLDPLIQTQTEMDEPEPLVDYLNAQWGINVRRDLIVDFFNGYAYSGGDARNPLFPLNKGYESSPITDKLLGISTVYPVARSVVVTGTAETFPDITYTPLVKTDDGAWGELDINSLSDPAGPTLGDDDSPGPLYLAIAAENRADQSRIVVFGDADFASDGSFANEPLYNLGANANLFVNSLNWATTEESLLNLALKTPTSRSLRLVDNTTVLLIFLFTVVVMPLSVLVLGGVMWFLRRRHT
jgi:ABC-type uncharacterized transport system involved in gliding motility auxiliary subunit